MSLSDVSNILWRERQLIELLVFKLEVEHAMLTAGTSRWLQHTTREIEAVAGAVKRAELDRAVEVQRVGGELGLHGTPTLRRLADAAPAPWSGILSEHRSSFLASTAELVALAAANRSLLLEGARAHPPARRAVRS